MCIVYSRILILVCGDRAMSAGVTVFVDYNANPTEASQVGLFKGEELSSIDTLLSRCPVLKLDAGQVLLSPGQPNHVLYLLLSGRLRVHEASLTADPVDDVEAGECIGVLSIINGHPCTEYVVADQDCRLLVVDEGRLIEFINSSHDFARNYFLLLMQYLRSDGPTANQHERIREKYDRASSVDELTGVHNRCWLEEMLPRQIMRSSTNQEALSLIMVDVDHFSEFTRDFGQTAADQALYTVVRSLTTRARPTDLVARYADDEFVIILPDTDLQGARILAERLGEVVSQTGIVLPKACILPPVTISLGVVQLKAFVAGEKLLLDAAAAAARAKAQGGNTVSE